MHNPTPKYIKCSHDRIDKIFHIADIHFRNVKRHEEYNEVLNRFYESVEKDGIENSIIIIAGDLAHSKLETSPELNDEIAKMLSKCASLTDTVVIPGNHDCVPPGHEILTRRGWVDISEFVENKMTDQVCMFDESDSKLKFGNVLNHIKKRFDGKLISFQGPHVDLLTTPTHQILYSDPKGLQNLKKKSASDIPVTSRIPLNGVCKTPESYDPFFELLGFSLSDGTFVLKNKSTETSRVQFKFKKQRKLKYLCSVLNRLNYTHSIRPQKDGTTVICIYSDLAKKICKFFNWEKNIPQSILSYDTHAIHSFINGVLNGDGNTVNNNNYRLTSINKSNLEKIQSMVSLIGGRMTIQNPRWSGNYKNSKIQYNSCISFKNKITFGSISEKSTVDYNGDVYCLTVPSSNLMIRRNNKIFITGNCNVNNKQRLDVISPIVEYMNNDRIHYLKENGLYVMKNLLFSHYGIFSDVENYITYKLIPKKYKDKTDTHIALYHGPMHKSTTDSDYEVSNVSVKPELFDGFHIGILGDIHKQQTIHIKKPRSFKIPTGWMDDPTEDGYIIKKFPILRYPGSLIQQNHSEKIKGHGFTIWDVKSKSYKHIELHNDYGFFTAEIKDGVLSTDVSDIPTKARLRFRCFETEPTEVKKILEDIKKSHDIKEVSYIRGDVSKAIHRGKIDRVSLIKLGDYHVQNKLIEEYLSVHKPKTPSKVINKIFEINKNMNSRIQDVDKPMNIIWKPKTFKFDNMFSYGKGNVVNFEKIEGITGIFGPNASGKSSIFSALCFCLFDKCDRTFKASHIMNESKMSFKCELNFEIEGVDFFVKRVAKRDKKGNVRVEVDFWKEIDGNKINLNDESRRSTNEVIRSYIGSYDDFVLTSLSPQKSKDNNFSEKGQTERKDLITKFLGIDVFDSLYQLSLEDSKEISTKMKMYDYNGLCEDVSVLEKEIGPLQHKLSEMNLFKDSLVEEHSSLLKQIIDKGSKIQQIDGVTDNISNLEEKFESLTKKLELVDTKRWETEIENYKIKIVDTKKELKTLEDNKLEERIKNFEIKKKELNETQSRIEVLKLDVGNKLEKVKFLENHEYNPDCEFCMKNEFVQDALRSKIELNRLKPIVEEVISKKESLAKEIHTLQSVEGEQKKHLELRSLLSSLSDNLHRFQNRLIDEKEKYSTILSELKVCEEKINKYHKSINVAKQNEQLELEIRVLHSQEQDISKKLHFANQKISDVRSDIKIKTSSLEEKKKCINELRELELENKAFQLYIESIHRDGVPYDIISKSVPEIEREINEILSQIVEFGILLDLDGKNINANLVYGERLWPIELASGMETFISSLAMRIALTNISNMPKTNFLAIDEGFGALDDDTFATIPALFSFLRGSFDFILIISHIDHVKDFVDSHIEIKKDKGFSVVNMT
jgi:DNA repair exonuclease SbcCD ATPase subunit